MLNFLFSYYLEDDEKIYYVAHRHPFIFLKAFLKYLFLGVFCPIVLFLFFPDFWMLSLLWIGIGFIRLIYIFMDWYFDAWLLTNTSVIDVDWNGFFNRSSNRVEYHMVEGVSYEFLGVMQTIFRFGNTYLQRIGTGGILTLEDAINPKKVETQVLKLQQRFVTEKSYRDHESLKALLTEMIHDHARKKR